MFNSREEILEYVTYSPETGQFVWAKTTSNKAIKGKKAGGLNAQGYHVLRFNGGSYRAHHLAWFLCFGVWPKDEIDHINRCRNDNRIENLREATKSQNMGNSGKRRHNTSGAKGVFWHRKNRNWRVKLAKFHIGCFSSFEEAKLAYRQAAFRHYGEFALTE